jgi:hypothetical protein
VRSRFGPEDEDAFFAARDEVVARFHGWLDERGLSADLGSDADLLLRFTWGYLDGDILTWCVEDLDAILLELYPREVTAPPDLVELVVPSTAAFLDFLADEGLLAPGSDPLPRLKQRLEELAEPFRDAMDDPSTSGMAKSPFGAMADDGGDPADAGSMDAWIESFNAGTYEERSQALRARMMPLPSPGGHPRRLPPVALAPEHELVEAARTAPAMRRLAGFVEHVRAPRELTDRGNLELADARHLVEALGTGDPLDRTHGDRTDHTRSSTELPVLDLTFRWAQAAGFVEVREGTVCAAALGQRIGEAPLEAFHDALGALLDLGITARRYEDDRYGFGWYAEDVDELVSEWLLDLYEHGEQEIDDLVAETWEMLDDLFDLGHVEPRKLAFHRDLVEGAVRRILGLLADLGVVRLGGVVAVPTTFGTTDEAGGTLALTDLGTWAVNRIAATFTDAPVVGTHADDEAGALLTRCADLPDDLARAELDAWVDARETADAAGELAEALRTAGAVDVALGFGALLRIGRAASEAVRRLEDDPRLRPYVTVWRVDALDIEAPDVVTDDPAEQVALLHAVLELRGPHPLAVWLPLLRGVRSHEGRDEIVRTVGELWRPRTEQAEEVLNAIIEVHPDEAVGRSARRGLFELRSSGGPA